MTSDDEGPATRAAPQERTGLRSRDFALLLAATFGALANYAPLLSVVPLWAAEGGSGGAGVGATTGVVMGTTVLTQLAMGRLLKVLTLRRLLGLGALLMGAVTPAYALSSALGPVLVVSAIRGVGFAMVVVAGSALVAELVPRDQWGKGAGIYGLAAGLPGVVCLPAGVWFAQQVGFAPVFLAATVLSLAAVPLVLSMSTPPGQIDRATPPAGSGTPLRPLGGPWLLLLATAVALGGVATFLPLALTSPGAASVALLALSVSMIVGRWCAGALGDLVGAGRLLVPAVATSAVGMGGLAAAVEYADTAVAGSVGAQVAGPLAAAVYGLGFGALQNDTLVVMLRRAGNTGHGVASTVWNVAYDAGTGVGAVLLGLLVAWIGHAGSFTVAAVLIALTAPAAVADAPRERHRQRAAPR